MEIVLLRLVIVFLLCALAFGAGVFAHQALPPDSPIRAAALKLTSGADQADQLARIESQLHAFEAALAARPNPSSIEVRERLQALEDAMVETLELNLEMIEAQ